MFELINVSKTVDGEKHLQDINLKLQENSFNVLLGPTLAGKTSLMRVMAGLDKVDAKSKLIFNEKDVTNLHVKKRSVAMVYQQFVNYQTMSVFDNIASPLVAAKENNNAIKEKVEDAANVLGIENLLDRKPNQLSGGQQQRVAIARALVKHADLVLLDEPLANLDYKLRESLREELPRIFADRNSIVVYATSDPAEALLIGKEVAVMHEGQVLQFGDVVKVFRQPSNLNAAKIFSDPPLNVAVAKKKANDIFIEDKNQEQKVAINLNLANSNNEDEFTLAFRAHHLQLDKPNNDAISFKGKVQITEITGSECFIHVNILDNDWVVQTAKIGQWEPGNDIEVYLDPKNLMSFANNEVAIS